MGRAKAVSDGLSWPMVFVIGLFHVGAIAALFLFSWQRLLVMAILYVLAINVGHRHVLSPAAHSSRLSRAQVD